MIDILVPVLGRPEAAQPLVNSIVMNTTVDYTVLFLCSEGDDDEFEACRATHANVAIVANPGGSGDYAVKINAGFRVTNSPYVLCAADDVEFTPGWDETLLAVARMSGCGVVGTNDMANRHVMNGGFSTHPLVTRVYIESVGGSLDGPGTVYHEGYDHNYPDRELCHLAQSRGEWAFALEARIIHHHPGFGRNADATYRKGHRNFQADHRLFLKRAAGWDYVGLVPQELRFVGRKPPR